MAMSKELKVGIWGGIISSLIVLYFLQPVVAFLWNTLISVGEMLQAGYVDAIYRDAATRNTSVMLRVILSGISVLLLFSIVDSNLLRELERDMSRRRPNNAPSSVGRPLKRFAFFPGPQFATFIIVCLSVLSAVIILVVAVISSGTEQTTINFDQRMAILAPSVSDQQIKEWKAQWAQMKSAADYRAIDAALLKRAADLKIELPKSKWK